MKKFGKKLSFLTKIMLVVGLLISNLSSLSVVFASVNTIDVKIVDDKLNIKYLEELADDDLNVGINVYEDYTYLDGEKYQEEITVDEEITLTDKISHSYNLTDEEVLMLVSNDENAALVLDSILSNIVFDGTYNVKVEIVNTLVEDGIEKDVEVLATANYSFPITHKSGLQFSVVDKATNEEINALEDGSYKLGVDNAELAVVGSILPGGLAPTDIFKYKDVEYMASELLELNFTNEVDFSGRLFGEYTIPVEIDLGKYNKEIEDYEAMDLSGEVKVLYGEYDLNTLALNTATLELGLNDSYRFDGNSQNGILYVLLNDSKVNTMLDLYNIVNYMFDGDEIVSYKLSNSMYDSVLDSYVENEEISMDDYLADITLDDSVVLSLINEGLTVTYKVVVAGDIDNDNKLTETDLLEVINQVVGETEVDLDKSDLYGEDDVVDLMDVIYLDQVMKNSDWNITLVEDTDAIIDSSLEVVETDIVSGQKFTVNYIVKLSDYTINGVSGLFAYDKEAFELDSVEVENEWLGNSKDGKFLYLGEESLALPEKSEEDDTTTEEDSTLLETKDYVVVRATFIAKSAGEYTINLEDIKYFNQDTYYSKDNSPISTTVLVNASNDNSLASLSVSGYDIVLEEDKLDYEITVSNDVTSVDVLAITSNVAANITSIVSPEELVEGENVVTVTVTAESGDVKVYTITVVREAAKNEETTTTQVNYNYSDDDSVADNNNEIVDIDDNKVVDDDDEEEVVEEESNLSRVIIIILILLVIAGLIYLIFKDDDEEPVKNKEINKVKKEEKMPEVKQTVKTSPKTESKQSVKTTNKTGKTTGKANGKTSNTKNKKTNTNNKNKER